MKKLLIIIVIASFITSCKKEQTTKLQPQIPKVESIQLILIDQNGVETVVK